MSDDQDTKSSGAKIAFEKARDTDQNAIPKVDPLSLPIPKLHPFLKLAPAPKAHDGAPQWTIYHPIAHKFYKIGWAEFECLSRFHKSQSPKELLASVKQDTGLEISPDEWEALILFLRQEGLTAHTDQDAVRINQDDVERHNTKQKSLSHKLMHGYLYFTIRLFRPQRFLSTSYPIVRPLLSNGFKYFMIILGLIALWMTIPRWDEFFGTFTQIMSMQGALILALTYFGIKVFHELGHAYAATKHNVPVPHMGLAFIILYPVFYTEVTSSWQLSNKKARIEIGLAGIKAEFFLSIFALIAWHFLEPGLGQTTAFSVVMISLIGSLFINLNPLMRFDGYYVASDVFEVENLHSVAIDYAKAHWRRALLGWQSPIPHHYPARMEKNLTLFGYAVVLYRFFLFLGIAILVYTYFMKPLGLIAMIFELLWFIGLPILKELKSWVEQRHLFMSTWRFRVSFLILLAVLIYICAPLSRPTQYPAIIYAQSKEFYAPTPARIETINVKNGQAVKQGDVLAVLSTKSWEQQLELAQQRLETLSLLRQRDLTDPELFRRRRNTINEEIEAARVNLNSLTMKKNALTLIAPYDGVISDLNAETHAGRFISNTHPLFRIIRTQTPMVRAFIPERKLNDFQATTLTSFRASYALMNTLLDIPTQKINATTPQSLEQLEFKSMSALYGGMIASQYVSDDNTGQRRLEPINAYYFVDIPLPDNAIKNGTHNTHIISGEILSYSAKNSLLLSWVESFTTLARKEFNLN